MPAARTGTDWLTTADSSWYLRVLTILQRDFPDAADMAWSTAISENAAEQIARYGSTGRTIGEAVASPIGDMRACPDCGRPQHYTGTEHGWAHDALIDMWHCADPRGQAQQIAQAGAHTERARQIVADPFAAAFDGVEEAEF